MTNVRTNLRASSLRASSRRAFSLIELLLSVFILAIGIISVSALFPAGIAQQAQTTDDQLGPVVAEQALGLLRSRVSPEDFGTFEEFGITNVLAQSIQNGNSSYVFRPCAGDWSWIRPGVIRSNQTGTAFDDVGAIDLFATLAQNQSGATQEFCEFPNGVQGSSGVRFYGAPYNTSRTSLAPPIIVTQRERWWPSVPDGAPITTPPTYSWDCMFRRHGGRIQVAIFVYRIIGVGGAVKNYVSPSNGNPSYPTTLADGNVNLPPVPYRRVPISTAGTGQGTTGPILGLQVRNGWEQPSNLSLTTQSPYSTGMFAATQGLSATDMSAASIPKVSVQWQQPGQWIIDNNGNVHRVAQGRRNASDPIQVRMSAPVPRVPSAQVFDDYELQPAAASTTDPVPQGVRTLHYVPTIIDANGTQLLAVYATVREL